MIRISPSKDKTLIKSILYHPVLAKTALPPEDQLTLEDIGPDNMNLDMSTNYLLAYSDDNLVGLVRWSKCTNITLEAHIHILPEFWGTGTSLEVKQACFTWWREHTPYQKLITFTPDDCKEVQKALFKFGLEPEGVLVNAILWNNRIQNLYIFGANIT